MFDLLEWKYEYEPVDFKGWIPDFAIIGGRGAIIYVEVKPVYELPHLIAAEIENSGCRHNCLILGATAAPNKILGSSIGWFGEFFSDGIRYEDKMGNRYWSDALCVAHFDQFCLLSGADPNLEDLDHLRCRLSNTYLSLDDIETWESNVASLWAEAGNVVQWKGRNAA
jgi:hypothetical protein